MEKLDFELLRTLTNSYYLNVDIPKLSVDCNLKRNLEIHQFKLELYFTFMKEKTDSQMKENRFELS